MKKHLIASRIGSQFFNGARFWDDSWGWRSPADLDQWCLTTVHLQGHFIIFLLFLQYTFTLVFSIVYIYTGLYTYEIILTQYIVIISILFNSENFVFLSFGLIVQKRAKRAWLPQDQGPVAAICAGATAALEALRGAWQQGVTFCGAKNIGKFYHN